MSGEMDQRSFIAAVGGAASLVFCPFAAHAQPGRLPTIGFLGTATLSTQSARVAAFVQRLRELGWIENRNVTIEYRWADGRSERWGEIAIEFARLKADVIVTSGTPVVIAAKQAAPATPIVFVALADPVPPRRAAVRGRAMGHWETVTFIAGLRQTGIVAPMLIKDQRSHEWRSIPRLRRAMFGANAQAWGHCGGRQRTLP
jgi:putative ABC transport system substrate-binding protein